MKRCPECRRDYYDDSLLYCLEDGAALVSGVPDEAPTAMFGVSPHADALEGSASSAFSDSPETQVLGARQTNDNPQHEIDDGKAALPTKGVTQNAFDKRLLVAMIATAAIVVAGFFGYRYFASFGDRIDSIAVMPFVNASGNADFEYLSDGMTEMLINSLAQIPDLSVKGRSSVFRYKGKDIEPQQIAGELGVASVLSGRVVQRGDSITLSLELTAASTGNQIWGDQYVRKLTDIVTLQKEIAQDVSEKLKAKLTSEQRQQLTARHAVNSEAYQLYLQGRYQWNKRTDEGVRKAEQLFQQAVERDPAYALAYVGLAESYVVVDSGEPKQKIPKSKAAALKALQLDPTLGEAHTVLANIAFYYEWDWPTAEREYKRALELSPNYPTTYHWYGETLAALGRFEESFVQYERARALDPVSLAIATDQGWSYFWARQYDRAIEHLKQIAETDPTFVRTHYYLAAAYEEKGMYPEAIEARRKGLLIGDANVEEITAAIQRLSDAYRSSGAKGYWETALKLTLEMSKNDPVGPPAVEIAGYYAKLNKADEAFQWLEKGFRERRSALAAIKVDPAWDNIRSDPRFTELVRKIGLP